MRRAHLSGEYLYRLKLNIERQPHQGVKGAGNAYLTQLNTQWIKDEKTGDKIRGRGC